MPAVLPLRLIVVSPPVGVIFRLQSGTTALVPPRREAADSITFELALHVAPTPVKGPPVLRGAFAQGPPNGRFVYLNAGQRAGQPDSCWDRRAKVPLNGITRELIDQLLATPGAVLEAQVVGTAGDGGPACASVPLRGEGWRVVQA